MSCDKTIVQESWDKFGLRRYHASRKRAKSRNDTPQERSAASFESGGREGRSRRSQIGCVKANRK